MRRGSEWIGALSYVVLGGKGHKVDRTVVKRVVEAVQGAFPLHGHVCAVEVGGKSILILVVACTMIMIVIMTMTEVGTAMIRSGGKDKCKRQTERSEDELKHDTEGRASRIIDNMFGL